MDYQKYKLDTNVSSTITKILEAQATIRLAYIDNGKPAAARFASTLIRSALDATATLRPLLLHCYTAAVYYRSLHAATR